VIQHNAAGWYLAVDFVWAEVKNFVLQEAHADLYFPLILTYF